MNKCRVCNNEFFKKPLLRLENMPKSAQFLPEEDSLKNDVGVDLEVCQCSGCGLVQIINEPVHYYKEVIRAVSISEEMKDFRLKQFDAFLKKFSLNGKKIIEIGCGRGEYLSIMNQLDVDAYGLEYSDEAVEDCCKRMLKVTKGYVDHNEYRLVNAPFDAFYILSFLEHMPNPNSALRGIYHNLSEGGIGLVEVPNFDMIIRKNLFSEFITDHIFYFTKETLEQTLSFNGFEIIDCREIWYDYIVSATVRKRKTLDIFHFYEHQGKIRQEITKFIQSFGKNVAVWGAGHQALALISLANLSDKIKYVIDSAKFKQGKYTPATHIQIVPPDMLDKDPVDAVIVIAGSYSDEVAGILRQKFDRNMHIAILRDYGLEIVNQ